MPDEAAGEAALRETQSRLASFVGLTPPEAQALGAELGLLVRVAAPGSMLTLDFRPTRVTVLVVDGRVVEATAG